MRRAHVLGSLALTTILITTAAAAATTGHQPSRAGSAALDTVTLVYDEPFNGGTGTFVDLGKPGLGAGDIFLTTGVPMLSHHTGKRIGVEDGTEIIISGAHDGTVEMNMTLRLPDGLVMLSGVVRHTDQPFRLPVVGGTGTYADVTGQMSEIRENRKKNVTVIKLELTY